MACKNMILILALMVFAPIALTESASAQTKTYLERIEDQADRGAVSPTERIITDQRIDDNNGLPRDVQDLSDRTEAPKTPLDNKTLYEQHQPNAVVLYPLEKN